MCACDEGRECPRHAAERERHDDEELREQCDAYIAETIERLRDLGWLKPR